MKETIIKKLRDIEREKGIKILYACESGSRAWGFPSKDSDYDVRFIYVHNLDWYLSIDEEKDHYSDVGKVLDFSGWELRKALKLFAGTNCGLFEKLQSPVVYLEETGFKEELWKWREECFNPISGVYHYLHQAQNLFNPDASSMKLKKYLYVLRGTLAVEWIVRNNEVPPMEFYKLRTLLEDGSINKWIDNALERKKTENESFEIELLDSLNTWIKEVHKSRLISVKEMKFSKHKKRVSELDKILKKWILTI